jgi:hypothetical protein
LSAFGAIGETADLVQAPHGALPSAALVEANRTRSTAVRARNEQNRAQADVNDGRKFLAQDKASLSDIDHREIRIDSTSYAT